MPWLYKAIADKTSEQYKFPFALWTRKLVAKRIGERWGSRLSKAPVCHVVSEFSLSDQRPLWHT